MFLYQGKSLKNRPANNKNSGHWRTKSSPKKSSASSALNTFFLTFFVHVFSYHHVMLMNKFFFNNQLSIKYFTKTDYHSNLDFTYFQILRIEGTECAHHWQSVFGNTCANCACSWKLCVGYKHIKSEVALQYRYISWMLPAFFAKGRKETTRHWARGRLR